MKTNPVGLILIVVLLLTATLLLDAFFLPTHQAVLPVTRTQCELTGLSGEGGQLHQLYQCSLYDNEHRLLTISNCTLKFEDYPGLNFIAERTGLFGKSKALLVKQEGIEARLLLHLFNNPPVLILLMLTGLALCLYPGLSNYEKDNVLKKALSRAGLLFCTGVTLWYLLV